MATQYPPKKNAALVFELDVFDYAGKFLTGATFSSYKVSKDGGTYTTLTNAPVEIGATGTYTISLTAAEMNADRVHLIFVITGAADIGIGIVTTARNFDDLAFPTVSGNGMDVSATGEVGLDFSNIKDASGAHTLTNITVPVVTTLTNAPADSSGVTTLLARLTSARAGYLDLLNTYLNSSVSAIKTVVDTVKAKTDLLPSDPADASDVASAVSAAQLAITTQTDLIKAKTVNLPASPAATGAQMDLVNAPNATAITAIQAGLATAANQSTILNRLGAFTGTGVNNILGSLRAMANKAGGVTTPSDLSTGGTFSNTTDSLEALRERGDAAWTGGGSAPTAAENADAVWDELRADHVAAGSFGEYVKADAVRVSGDATAADNAEAYFDGTGYAGTNNVIPTVTTLTNDPGGVTTLLSRLSAARAGYLDILGGWAGTLLTALQAMARKDVLSADLGGTFDATTDSLEALREQVDELAAEPPQTVNVEIHELNE